MSTVYAVWGEAAAIADDTLVDADKAMVLDASVDTVKIITMTQLRRLLVGGGAPVSAAAATLTVASASHAGRTVTFDRAAGTTATLPAATGSGDRYRFVTGVAVSGGSTIIQVTGNDVMYGYVLANSTGDTPDLAQPWPTAVDSDTITLNGTTTGGAAVGDWIELEDIATDKWAVRGWITASGTEATPFSAAV